MSEFLQGATMLASFAVALFFLRYWRETTDRLFAVFAAAFLLFGASRIALLAAGEHEEARLGVYLLRTAAFAAIALAILDKNLRRDQDTPPQSQAGSSFKID